MHLQLLEYTHLGSTNTASLDVLQFREKTQSTYHKFERLYYIDRIVFYIAVCVQNETSHILGYFVDFNWNQIMSQYQKPSKLVAFI